uniref:Aspartic peptidase DDI1-type domain-containing protein n=1 Tax=Physcomitrium patens TaxID=3218 RepID=A0A2K1KJV4_PHYPA|nr:hypothetical protein PHYPA_007732 [Physcomitrium patens]
MIDFNFLKPKLRLFNHKRNLQLQNLQCSNNSNVIPPKNYCEVLNPNLSQSNALSNCTKSSKNVNESSIAIILGSVNGIETDIHIDSGSTISAITETFVQKLNLQTLVTRDILVVTLANAHIKRQPEQICLVTLKIKDFESLEVFNILPNQMYNVTLGKNWLKKNKIVCDYGRDLLFLPNFQTIQMGCTKLKALLANDVILEINQFMNKCNYKIFKNYMFEDM